MDVTPLVKEGTQIIQSYAGGAFRISGVSYNGPVFVMQTETVRWDNVDGKIAKELSADDFIKLAEQSEGIDVVLLGSGDGMQFLSPQVRKDLKAQGLSVEVMDTGAACRTFNVLMAEGRRVVAALLPTS